MLNHKFCDLYDLYVAQPKLLYMLFILIGLPYFATYSRWKRRRWSSNFCSYETLLKLESPHDLSRYVWRECAHLTSFPYLQKLMSDWFAGRSRSHSNPLTWRSFCTRISPTSAAVWSSKLSEGKIISLDRCFTEQDVISFFRLCKLGNSIHLDVREAQHRGLSDRKVPEFLYAGLFPAIIGTHFVSLLYPFFCFSYGFEVCKMHIRVVLVLVFNWLGKL